MNLEVNKSHKGIRFDKLKKPLRKFAVGIAGVSLAISLYSGFTNSNVYASEVDRPGVIWNVDDEKIEIPEIISDSIALKVGKSPGDTITSSDLDKITFLTLNVDDSVISLEFLQYFHNLKDIVIILETDIVSILNDLSYSKSIESVSITSRIDEYHNLTNDNLSFIDKLDSVKNLIVTEFTILTPGCEENLNKLDELTIVGGINYDLDFSKLDNLKVLNLMDCDPYDIAIYLNSSEYNALIDRGVEIKFRNDDSKKKYLDACFKLDEIVDGLDIKPNSSTEEKMNSILIYVLENLEYDKEISKLIQNNMDTDDEVASFYEDGKLYGALYKNSSICGNYAALTEALMDRLDIPRNSFFATSSNHAWNVIRIKGEPYYVDATWLDEQNQEVQQTVEKVDENGRKIVSISYEYLPASDVLRRGNGKDLDWYMESISDENISSLDRNNDHDVSYLPSYITDVEENDKDKSEDIAEKDVKVKIGTKEIVIGTGALLGILSAVGGGVIAIRRKKKKDEKRRMMMDNYYWSDYSSINEHRKK